MPSLLTAEKLTIKVCVCMRQGDEGGSGLEERTLKRKIEKKHSAMQRANNIDLNQFLAPLAEAQI